MESNESFFKVSVKLLGNGAERIDKYLVGLPGLNLTRSALSKLFENESVTLNGTPVKKSQKVKDGQVIMVYYSQKVETGQQTPEIAPIDIPFDIVYEDQYFAVINKPCGLVVHPGQGEVIDQTLVNALLYKFGKAGLSDGENPLRPGIVHRLDKDTSGLMIICKTNDIHSAFKSIFKERKIQKWYQAIVVGKFKEEHSYINSRIMRHPSVHHKMTVTDSTKGKEASTEYFVKQLWKTRNGYYSLLYIQIHTGKTHQIRVHLQSTAHPIVGDVLYHKKSSKHNVENLCLVAQKLIFTHPINSELLSMEVPLPKHFTDFVNYLNQVQLPDNNDI
jgi:23S rRNA pseudouridine1911/1915/1917 synthase